ncbi:MAG: glycerate kinase family protein [Planctomycetota bacterium]|jgi:glycerate kinase
MNDAPPRTRFLIAPDSFKGSLGAMEVAGHIAGGIRSVDPNVPIRVMPLADGGEGTIEAVQQVRGGEETFVPVHDPLGLARRAPYLLLGEDTAVIEMARASGLPLVPRERRDPLQTTTYGVGEMIRHAVLAGVRKILVGTGGSATVDGGTGALSALGIRFLDRAGRPLPQGGGHLEDLSWVVMPPSLSDVLAGVEIRVLCDVDNPLLGPRGAARTFGAQKGASPEGVDRLEKGLGNFAEVTREVLGVDLGELPGAGSAGGLAGGLGAYVGAELCLGAPRILDLAGFDEAACESDRIVTGEGCLDATSQRGKVVGAVVERAARAGVAVAVVAGRLGTGYETVLHGDVRGVHACFPPDAPDDASLYADTPWRLSDIGRALARGT